MCVLCFRRKQGKGSEGEAMGGEEEGWTWRALAVAVTAAYLVVVLLHVTARVADALWWRPKRLEARFAWQGVRGPSYQFLVGCVREMVALMAEATVKPMSPATSHNTLPRVLAFYHFWRKIYGPTYLIWFGPTFLIWFGPTFLIWFGPTPRLTVAEPELIREIFRADKHEQSHEPNERERTDLVSNQKSQPNPSNMSKQYDA